MAAAIQSTSTPWQNQKEWELVYNELYSGDTNQQQHAVDKLGMWIARFGERTPTAVISSHDLMAALLVLEEPSYDCETLTVKLSEAVSLFVNYMTDKKQTAKFAMSVIDLGMRMGIPEWLVEVRHQLSHRGRRGVSLNILIKGAKFALNWLEMNYWKTQMEGLHQDKRIRAPTRATINSIKQILIEYKQEGFKVLASGESRSEEMCMILDNFYKLTQRDADVLIAVDVLLKDDHFILDENQLDILGVRLHEQRNSGTLSLPNQVIKLWDPLLENLHRKDFILPLVEQLSEFDQDDDTSEFIIMGWLLHILKTYGKRHSPNGSTYINVSGVIHTLLENPNKYTLQVLETAWNLEHCYSEEQQQEFTDLVKLVTGNIAADSSSTEVSDDRTFTLDDVAEVAPVNGLEEDVDDEDLETSQESTTNKELAAEGWRLADPSIPWARYPLGTCPNYTDGDPLALELYDVFPMKQYKNNVTVEQQSESCEEEDEDVVESEEKSEETDMEIGIPETKPLETQNVTQAACKNVSEKKIELYQRHMVYF